MSPSLAGIGRLVDSIANGKIGAMQAFPAGDVNDVGIGGSNRDGADRLRRFVVKDGCPGTSIVVRLPHSSVDLAYVKDIRLARYAAGGSCATAAKRADHAPA